MSTEGSAQELREKFEQDLEQAEHSALLVLCVEVLPLLRDLLAGGWTEEARGRVQRALKHAYAVKGAHQGQLDALLADAARTTRNRSKEDSTGL